MGSDNSSLVLGTLRGRITVRHAPASRTRTAAISWTRAWSWSWSWTVIDVQHVYLCLHLRHPFAQHVNGGGQRIACSDVLCRWIGYRSYSVCAGCDNLSWVRFPQGGLAYVSLWGLAHPRFRSQGDRRDKRPVYVSPYILRREGRRGCKAFNYG